MHSLAQELSLPTAVADPIAVPAFGGVAATAIWNQMGVHRHGVGGVPCQMVHGTMATNMGLGTDCFSNAGARFLTGFMQALPIYLSVSSILYGCFNRNAYYVIFIKRHTLYQSSLLDLAPSSSSIACSKPSLVFYGAQPSWPHSSQPTGLAYVSHAQSSSLNSSPGSHTISGMDQEVEFSLDRLFVGAVSLSRMSEGGERWRCMSFLEL